MSLYQLHDKIWQLIFKLIVFTLKVAVTVLFSTELDKRIKANEKWESEYDEYTAHVTKRKYFH